MARSPQARARGAPRVVRLLSTVVVVATSLAIIGIASGRVASAASYRPLEGGAYLGVRGAKHDPERPRGLRYQHGEVFAYLFDVSNGGRWPVTVTGVVIPPADEYEFLAERIGVEMGRRKGLGGPPVAFRPFRLDPGESRLLYMRARFGHCDVWEPGALMGISGETIRYEAFGFVRTMVVRFARELIVVAPPGRDCPLKRRPAGP